MIINIPTSIGELIDKITILEIKKEKITEIKKVNNVSQELNLLRQKLQSLDIPDIFEYMMMLYIVNKELWHIEDELRKKEKQKVFDQEFINLARSVYYTNDKRAELKKELNILVGSTLIEEKHYDNYK